MKQYILPEGTFSCLIQKNGCFCILNYAGDMKQLFIPDQIDGFPIVSVGKKAFWQNHYLQHIILPDTIERVDEWAFAGCSALRKVTIPRREILFGNHVFQKTDGLREISFAGSDPSVDRLMAAAATVLKAEYLLSPLQAGSDSWYRNLDARILTMINESGDNALRNLVYCAEEDMGAKQEACLREQAHKKGEIAFLRLIHSNKISSDMFKMLADHLRLRTIGCAEASAWEVIMENVENQKAYCDILIRIGGICEDNFHAVLEDLGEDAVELKAYLLKKWQSRIPSDNLWETLEL